MFESVKGSSGYVLTGRNTKIGIINRWIVKRSGAKPGGSSRLRLRASFSFVNNTLMELKIKGVPLPKSVVVEVKNNQTNKADPVEVVAWDEWIYDRETQILTLEGVIFSGR